MPQDRTANCKLQAAAAAAQSDSCFAGFPGHMFADGTYLFAKKLPVLSGRRDIVLRLGRMHHAIPNQHRQSAR
jgi:hypothetical protein